MPSPDGDPTMQLPYGRTSLSLDLADAIVVEAAALPPAPALAPLIDAAFAAPIGRPPIEDLVRGIARPRVTIAISDPTRREPRAEFIAAIRARLRNAEVTIAIATGTHGPANVDELGLDLRDVTLVNHDGASDLVDLGVTAHGTPIRLHRCVVESDLVVATGCIRPHYFAGFGAGTKAIFPGLGEATAIRINHALKTAPGARAGIVDGNPCRADLEEVFRAVPTPSFLLNGVMSPAAEIHAMVAGDPIAAHRAGCDLARPWFTARAPRASLVIASDALPVSASLYQASKIAAAAAPLVADGGTLAIVAECADGVEPLATVNEAILRIGVLPRLPPGARLVLVSSLPRSVVETTLCEYAASIDDLIRDARGPIVVIPRASQLLLEPTP